MRTDDGKVSADLWADGFFGAIRLAPPDWQPLFMRKNVGEPAIAIIMHCSDSAASQAFEQIYEKSFANGHVETWRALPIAVEDIYRHCKPLRSATQSLANDA
jgi:uncharacterized protein